MGLSSLQWAWGDFSFWRGEGRGLAYNHISLLSVFSNRFECSCLFVSKLGHQAETWQKPEG